MKTHLQLAFISIILTCCSSAVLAQRSTKLDKHSETVYFEGEIHFTIDYDSVPTYIGINYFKENQGSKMIMVFKNGSNRKEYYSPDGKLLTQRFLDLESNKFYGIDMDEDTVYWYYTNIADSKTDFVQLNDTTIRDYECLTVRAKTVLPHPSDSLKDYVVKSVYYIAKELAINPLWYVDYLEGNYNEMVQVTKAIALETHQKWPNWNTSIIIDKVIWRKVKKREIKVPRLNGRLLKEL